MNKTININLASTFFYMDENAYTILKSYLNELESAFKNTLGKDEILQDIETRIAELFQERKTSSDYVINETDVNEYKLIELSELFVSLENDAVELEAQLHQKAKVLLSENKLEEAWLTLLAFNN
mgnify:CR=1 FL=1